MCHSLVQQTVMSLYDCVNPRGVTQVPLLPIYLPTYSDKTHWVSLNVLSKKKTAVKNPWDSKECFPSHRRSITLPLGFLLHFNCSLIFYNCNFVKIVIFLTNNFRLWKYEQVHFDRRDLSFLHFNFASDSIIQPSTLPEKTLSLGSLYLHLWNFKK